jgi:beta-galactosidase GanA
VLDAHLNHTYNRVLSSGEFHTFRLPVPGLWLDILQKVKAAGFNAISVYTHMALINPSPGVIDFNDYRALEPLYEAAKQTGVWTVLRPGMGSLEFGGICANGRQDLTLMRRRLLEASPTGSHHKLQVNFGQTRRTGRQLGKTT